MRAALLLASLLLLAGCGEQADEVDPGRPAGGESANQLMGEAERAASNAQKRMNQAPAATPAPEGGRK